MSVVVCFCCCFAFPPNRSDENSNDEMKCFVIVFFSLLLFGWMMVDLIWPISSLSYIFRLSFSLRCFRAVVIVVFLYYFLLCVCVIQLVSLSGVCVFVGVLRKLYVNVAQTRKHLLFVFV